MTGAGRQAAYDEQLYEALEGAYYGDAIFEPHNSPRRAASQAYYTQNPAFQQYFASLPPRVRRQIIESGVEFSTQGELRQCAEHLMHT